MGFSNNYLLATSAGLFFHRANNFLFAKIGNSIVNFPILSWYKKHLLSTWQAPEKRKFLDHLLLNPVMEAWFKFEFLIEKDPARREELKALAMGGNSGVKWAEHYASQPLDFTAMIGSLALREACPIYDEIDRICNSGSSGLLVIQLGSSSGREIAYFAARYPRLKFIGTDIYQEVIDYSARAHPHNNLEFVLSQAHEINRVLSDRQSQEIVIFSSSSLQYVQPEYLEVFFERLSAFKNLQVLINEPASDREANPEELSGSLWRGAFSYTHNYKYYAEKFGFKTLICKIIKPYLDPQYYPPVKLHTVHYFYHGRVKAKS